MCDCDCKGHGQIALISEMEKMRMATKEAKEGNLKKSAKA